MSRQTTARAVIVLVALAAHGLIVINNGILFDDWALYLHIARGDWAAMAAWVPQIGGIPTYLYVWIAGASIPPPLVGFRVAALLLIVGAALVTYEIAMLTGLVSRIEAVVIACLAVAYPGDHTHILLITLNYLVYYLLFLVAVWVLLRAETAAGWRRRLLQAIAVVLLFVSFGLNSLLVFFAGALLLGAIYLRTKGRLATREDAIREGLKHAYLLVVPVVFWAVYRVFFPPHGVYSGYHQFEWSLGSLLHSAEAFLVSGIAAQFRNSIAMLGVLAPLWLLVLFAVHRVWLRREHVAEALPGREVMLGFGAALAALAVFPYMAVGLDPSEHGWNSRHTLLLGLPVAIVLVAGAQVLFRTRGRLVGVLAGAVLASLLLGFILASAATYIGWEARWIKDSSVMAKLARTPGADRYFVYWIDDGYQVGGEPTYRYYEWAGMLRTVFGGESRIGLDRRATPANFLTAYEPYFTDIYNLGAFDPRGCEAVLTISRGPERHSDLGLVARYLFYSAIDQAQRDRMLREVTSVKVEPYPSAFATDCAVTP